MSSRQPCCALCFFELIFSLVGQVRYFEELVKESETNDRPVGGLVQVMMKNLSISVWEDEDIQRTLSFFEKVLTLNISNFRQIKLKWWKGDADRIL